MKFNLIRKTWVEGSGKPFKQARHVQLILPRRALSVIFDECDHFDRDETGGRMVGTFSGTSGDLTVRVTGVIEAGPNAQRSAVSFFQDGEHQERVFREIEHGHPDIEHLGNWHTHHCNGLSQLSSGDIATYQRTVNHPNHNTDFFYALLVVAREKTNDPDRRYKIKHYIFRRGDENVYEIPDRLVEIVDTPLVWPRATARRRRDEQSSLVLQTPDHEKDETRGTADTPSGRNQRAHDREVIAECYSGIRPFSSSKLGLYWRGRLEFVDGSNSEVVVVEEPSARVPKYTVMLRQAPAVLKQTVEQLAQREFSSASAALITMERACNKVLFDQQGSSRSTKT